MNAQAPKIKVLYRDANLIAVHKPHGVATYRESRGGNADGCKELLEEQLNERMFPVHRIDADTSGVVIFALDSRTASGLTRAFKEHKVNKSYLAWCVGEVPADGSIRKALKKNKSEDTESARTDYERLRFERGFSLVKVFPTTGRFHQIRRHFDSIGHALVVDPLYGDSALWSKFFKKEPRLMLQAEELELVHPVSKKTLYVRTKEKLG